MTFIVQIPCRVNGKQMVGGEILTAQEIGAGLYGMVQGQYVAPAHRSLPAEDPDPDPNSEPPTKPEKPPTK